MIPRTSTRATCLRRRAGSAGLRRRCHRSANSRFASSGTRERTRVVDLVAVAEPVDQTRLVRLGGGARDRRRRAHGPASRARSRPAAMAATASVKIEEASRSSDSRWAGVNSVRVSRSAAFLYSYRCSNCGSMPTLSKRPAEEGRLDPDPQGADGAGRLQPDLAEGGGQDVGGQILAALTEALGPGHGRLAARRERLHAQPQLLAEGPRQPTDPGDQPDHPAVRRRPRAGRAGSAGAGGDPEPAAGRRVSRRRPSRAGR